MGLPRVEIIERGRMDDRDSAFPRAVELPGGDILCSMSVGGGPRAEGGTELYRSRDGGSSWKYSGVLLPRLCSPPSTNCLRISISKCGGYLYAYGARFYGGEGKKFGSRETEPVFCISEDSGRTWSPPAAVPMPCGGPFEISDSVLALESGRLLAPAATLPSDKRLGETVLTAVSEDNGATWGRHAAVFRDPARRLGFFEHKLAEYAPGRLIAVCWTVIMPGVEDITDSFALSDDGGLSWGAFRSTGISGQTMTPVPLGGNRLLVLYNRRYGNQGIVAALVLFEESGWKVESESMLYDAGGSRVRGSGISSGVEEFDEFEFGFPTAIRLSDGALLATYWSKENGKFGVSWARLSVVW